MRAGTSNAGAWLKPQERDETAKATGAKVEENGPGEKSGELQCLHRRDNKRLAFTQPGREHRTSFKERENEIETNSINSKKVKDKNTAR